MSLSLVFAQDYQSQCDHIRKFSNSLIFNSIERVVKAGSEFKLISNKVPRSRKFFMIYSEEGLVHYHYL